MATLSFQQFITQYKSMKAAPVYLLLGSDAYLTDQAWQAIREKAGDKAEIVLLYGDEVNSGELDEYLAAYSIFASRRLVFLRNAEKLKANMLSVLTEYVKDPDGAQTLVISYSDTDKLNKTWADIASHCVTVDCFPPKNAGAMRVWLDSTLQQRGIQMDYNAKKLFLDKVELDFSTAFNELEKLIVYATGKKLITETDVKATLPTTRAGAISDFYKALGFRNAANVITRVQEMLSEDWEPLMIMGTINRFFLIIWKILTLRAQHISAAEIMDKHLTDIYPTYRKDYLAYAERYKPADITRIYGVLLDTDSKLKLSMAEPSILLDMCITRICSAKPL